MAMKNAYPKFCPTCNEKLLPLSLKLLRTLSTGKIYLCQNCGTIYKLTKVTKYEFEEKGNINRITEESK